MSESSIRTRAVNWLLPDPVFLLMMTFILMLVSAWFWAPVLKRWDTGDARITYTVVGAGVLLTFGIVIGGPLLIIEVLG